MAEQTIAEKFGLTYTKVGDHYLPNLTVGNQPEGDIGRYGRMKAKYLKEHKKGLYTNLELEGTLKAYLLNTQRQATEMQDRLMKQMAQQRGITEALKATDQMRWVGEMNNIKAATEEIVRNELIYN